MADWEYHQDGRDKAATVGMLMLVLVGLLVVALLAYA